MSDERFTPEDEALVADMLSDRPRSHVEAHTLRDGTVLWDVRVVVGDTQADVLAAVNVAREALAAARTPAENGQRAAVKRVEVSS